MKKLLIVLLVLVIAVVAVWKFVFSGKKNSLEDGTKLTALVVSQHSESFNQSMQQVMNAYFDMVEGFVNWDTVAIARQGNAMLTALDGLPIQEMEKDSAIYPTAYGQWEAIKSETDGLVADEGLEEKKASLNMLSQQLFDFLRIIRYDLAKVYFWECPMSLDDYQMPANWLSASNKNVRNPYLGTKDPKYGSEMLTCGVLKTALDYRVKDSTAQKQ